MSEPFISGGSHSAEPPITTVEGLKKEANTAVIRYFAPVFALYNELATTDGLPTVRWHARTRGVERGYDSKNVSDDKI